MLFRKSARTLEGMTKMVVDGILASTGEVNTIPVTAQEFYTKIGSSSGVTEEFMYKGTYVKMRELSIGWNLQLHGLSHSSYKLLRFLQ